MKRKLSKFLILIILSLIVLIVSKNNPQFKQKFYKLIYEDNISFAKINNWYYNKFGSPLPFSEYVNDTIPVFNENLEYSEAIAYKDGVSLKVGYEYLVPSLDNGIVIFIGEKEGYGNTLILQQENGIDVWYANLDNINVKLYDYVKKGSLLSNCNDNLYLVFTKNGEIVDYKEFI